MLEFDWRRGAVVVAGLMLGCISISGAQEAPGAPESTGTGEEAAAQSTLSPQAEKGRYLAIAGNCMTCHTTQSGKPFAGGVKFETPFGTLYSTNITQDPETGIGKWSLNDFRKAMRKGVAPGGTNLYPAFPYTSFTKLSDEDIAAIYAYLKTISPVSQTAKANEMRFPYNLRFLMGAWNMLYHKAGAYAPDTSKSAEWNRGAYLVEGLGHCGACHTPRNFLGAEQHDKALTGGVYLDEVEEGKYRPWSAVNLTPAKTGLAAWSTEDLVDYLKTGKSARTTTFGPMNEVIINSTSQLSDADVHAIAVYLQGIPANSETPGEPPDKHVMGFGETQYAIHCGTCHLPTGLGDPILGVPLAGSPVVQAADPSSLINNMLYGPKLPPYPFSSSRKPMKAFASKLRDEQAAALATYVRNSWGNQGSAVTPEQVARQR